MTSSNRTVESQAGEKVAAYWVGNVLIIIAYWAIIYLSTWLNYMIGRPSSDSFWWHSLPHKLMMWYALGFVVFHIKFSFWFNLFDDFDDTVFLSVIGRTVVIGITAPITHTLCMDAEGTNWLWLHVTGLSTSALLVTVFLLRTRFVRQEARDIAQAKSDKKMRDERLRQEEAERRKKADDVEKARSEQVAGVDAQEPATTAEFVARASQYLELGETEKAQLNFDAALVIDPNCAEAHVGIGKVKKARKN